MARSIAVGNRASEAHHVVRRVRELGVFLQIYNGTFRVFALTVVIYFITVIVTNVAVTDVRKGGALGLKPPLWPEISRKNRH